MATSGTTTRAVTAGDLVREAMVELGVISPGETPNDEEMDGGLTRLNDMLGSWAVDGNLFREASGTLTIDEEGSATLPDGVRDITSIRVSTGSIRIPLAPYTRAQYRELPNPDQTGARPITYYWSQQRDGDQITVWPKPAAGQIFTLYIDYSRGADVVTAPDEEVDIPNEWLECARINLAARMSSMFGATQLDAGNVQRIDALAGGLYRRMLDADRPDSIIMAAY
jgi:hypothetical protein